MNNASAGLLNDLLALARDGERFYRDAAAKVASPALRDTFRQMADVRQRLAETESVRAILQRHLLTVRAAHDRMRALKDQSAPA